MNANIVSEIKKEIKKLDFLSSHDYYHMLRVYNNVVMICAEETVSEQVALTAQIGALLHDVSHKKVSYTKRNEHEQESADIATAILAKYNLLQEDIQAILECILNHRASKQSASSSLAVQILQDADRLDALGAIAIARTFSYDSNRPIYLPEEPPKPEYDGISLSSVNHIVEKILKLTPDTFNTAIAKNIAHKRLTYVQGFVDEFLKEWNGER
jgi:uncharacterized protein